VRACARARASVFRGIVSNSDVVKIMLHKMFAERNPYINLGVSEQVSLVESHFVVCCIIVATRTNVFKHNTLQLVVHFADVISTQQSSVDFVARLVM
jgi:hypothetical protein